MTKLFSTKGFVLGRRDHKESDRVYTFFSKDIGKVDILARGARKITSKLSPHMESHSCVNVFLVDGRRGFTLAGADIETPLAMDHWKLAVYSASIQLISLGTRWSHEEPGLFQQLVYWLEFISNSEELSQARRELLLGCFALRVVSHCGYRPELFHCLSCSTRVEPDSFMWSSAKGGVVCKPCFRSHEDTWMKIHALENDVIKLLRMASDGDWEDLAKVEIVPEVVEGFLTVIDSLILAHFPVIPSVSIAHMLRVDERHTF